MSISTAEPEWLYERTPDNSARFVLGPVGQNPLVCFGVNPSTATPEKLDPTVTRVKGFADRNGHDSWIMLNLYPQRATDPDDMDRVPSAALKAENERQIAQLLADRQLTLLATWGGLITSRTYLPALLRDIVKLTDAAGCDWVSLGDPIGGGHPRHPSRAPGAMVLQRFDMARYLSRLP